jgi:membrane-bound serine protease (ClpP class)
MRSRPRRVGLAVLLLLCALLVTWAGEASGAGPRNEHPRAGHPGPQRATTGKQGIDVVQVEGLIDPPIVSLVRDSIRDANRRGSTLLMLQINSGGSVDADVAPMLRDIQRSKVPIVAWVGPSGARAKGAVALLVEAAPVASVSPGSSIGPAHPLRLDHPGEPGLEQIAAQLARLARRHDRNPAGASRLATHKLSGSAARHAHAINNVQPTVGELIVSLDGRTVTTAAGPRLLSTAKVVGKGLGRRRQPNQEVRFRRLDLGGKAIHTLTSPSIAYVLFVAGLSLIVFEFFTAGIGLAGAAGALAVVGALTGFSHLPVKWWAVSLLILAVFGYAVDVQAGLAGAWTFIGTGALVAGSLTLYGGSARLNPPWWVLALVIVGTLVFMLGAMTAVVRSRFSTPTIGREGMIGEMGRAEIDVAPDGVVLIQGARWRARTNRATPIAAGDAVRVVSVEGLMLEVEPDAGGAQDYRERARERAQDRAQRRTRRA